MNLLVILGASAIVAPLPFLATSFVDLMVAILAPIVLLVLALLWKKNQIGKKEGIVLTLVYVAYLIYLILLETTK